VDDGGALNLAKAQDHESRGPAVSPSVNGGGYIRHLASEEVRPIVILALFVTRNRRIAQNEYNSMVRCGPLIAPLMVELQERARHCNCI
jgi:hypothetical protein